MKPLEIKHRVIGGGEPLICVPVVEQDAQSVIREITYLSQSTADMIEWRVDAFRDFTDYNAIRSVFEAVAPLLGEKLFLYTFRTAHQGGMAQVKAEQLDDLHDLAAESGCVDLVDLEFFEEDRPLHKIKRLREMGVSVIASHHDFEQTPSPEVMKMLLEKMCAGGADIVKLAVMPQNYKDVLNLLDVTAQVQSASTVTERVTLQQTICREGTAVLTDRQNLLLQPGESRTVSFRYCVDSPALWSPENPNLYTSTMQVLEGEEELDREETSFGIRTLSIDAAHGVRINGQTVKLRGACIHHDNGILGAATLPDAEERRIRQLKEAGFNAIRSSHHPAGRALLDACDRYGVLVMDELSDVWNVRKNPYDYALYFEQDWKPTIQKMVAKDYNHPSVILYCVGNEISEAGSESGAETNRRRCNTFRELDPTRYTTNALNGLMAAGYRLREIMGDVMRKFPAQPGPSGGDGGGSNALNSFMSLMSGEKGDYFATHPLLTEALSGCEDSCDVIGLNYLTGRHVLEHELHPHKAVLGTETYPADIVRLWRIVEENPHMIGDFTWAGYDYLGEAGCGIFHYDGGANFSSIYPERTAYIGDLDLLGNRRPISYLREIVYGLRKAPYLAVLRMEHNGQTSSKTPWMFKDNLSSWTWPGFEGQTASVDVYSASEEVELFLNGASLGRRAMVDFTATYSVPYTPGELKAVGYTGGVCDGEFTLRTAQDAQMTLTADRKTLQANGEDAAFVMIQFVDANGTADLHTKHTLKVELEGAGILEAVGSANPCSEERYDTPESETFDGCCMAVIRAGEAAGEIHLIVTADDSVQKQLTILIQEAEG
mgnify:CR=1 FL=1